MPDVGTPLREFLDKAKKEIKQNDICKRQSIFIRLGGSAYILNTNEAICNRYFRKNSRDPQEHRGNQS